MITRCRIGTPYCSRPIGHTGKHIEPVIRREWVGGSSDRPLIVKVEQVPHPWHWQCPGHGGFSYDTWEEAQLALELHLTSRWAHPLAAAS